MKKTTRGFTIFFATLVASLALAIGLAIYDITVRQLDLSTTVIQSEYAIYAADSGAECALYWDAKYNGSGSAFASNNNTVSTTYIYLTSGTSWVVPSDWNNANNSIEVIGGGGGGGGSNVTNNTGAGGGGAYAKVSNVTLVPNTTVTYAVGGGGAGGNGNGTSNNGGNGGDTYLCNSTSNCASVSGTAVVVGAKGGAQGTAASGGGAGGASSGSVGTIKYAGGAGGSTQNFSGKGGGGAGSPNGTGASGGSGSSGPRGGAGGGGSGGGSAGGGAPANLGAAGGTNSNLGGSGSGGTAASPNGAAGTAGGGGGGGYGPYPGTPAGSGGAGGAGIEWDSAHGSGGGGGGSGCCSPAPNGGNGGLYGGGGGSSSNGVGGAGAQGIIVIRYVSTNPVATPTGVVCGSYDMTIYGTPPIPFASETTGWSPWNVVSNSSAATTTFTVTFPSYSYCATVQVAKYLNSYGSIGTTIYSHGYNTCSTGAQNQLERELKVSY